MANNMDGKSTGSIDKGKETNKSNDLLFDTLRKELTLIMQDVGDGRNTKSMKTELNKNVQSSKQNIMDRLQGSSVSSQSSLNRGDSDLFGDQPTSSTIFREQPTSSTSFGDTTTRHAAERVQNVGDSWSPTINRITDRNTNQIVVPKIDADIRRMQDELGRSYELFQKIGEKFESINFKRLNSRIKDLHLSEQKNETTEKTLEGLSTLFRKGASEISFNNLIKEVGAKFRYHPGEFGDIPEISEFFTACNQLQSGLNDLRKQRQTASELSSRITQDTLEAYDRINEIQKQMNPTFKEKK